MTHAWHQLDNIGKFYSAQAGAAVQTVFRYAATMADEIDPTALQAAVDETCAAFPGFNVVLRSGFFWHYLEEAGRPVLVEPEYLPVCQSLNVAADSQLMRVSYYHDRINLEVSHIVSDGRGTLSYFKELLRRYCMAHYGVEGVPAAYGATVAEQAEDGFRRLRERRARQADARDANETEAGARDAGAGAHPAEGKPTANEATKAAGTGAERRGRIRGHRVYRIPGRRSSFDPSVFEFRLSTAALLQHARTWGVSLTSVVIAATICALRDGMEPSERSGRRAKTIRVSIPVDLRAAFASATTKNFFALAFVEYAPGPANEPLSDLARQVQRDLARAIEPRNLERRTDQMVALERNPILRLAPSPLKDFAMATGDRLAARKTTVSVSNLGRIQLDARLAAHVRAISILTSTDGLSLTLCSLGGVLSIGVSSAFARTASVYALRHALEELGASVEMATNRELPARRHRDAASQRRLDARAGAHEGAHGTTLKRRLPAIQAIRRRPVARRVLWIVFGSVAAIVALLALLLRWPWQATVLSLSGIALHYLFFRNTFVQQPDPARVAVRYPFVALAFCILWYAIAGMPVIASVVYPSLCLAALGMYAGLFIALRRDFVSRYAKYLLFVCLFGLLPLAFPALGLPSGGMTMATGAVMGVFALAVAALAPHELTEELRRLFAT